MNVQYDFTETGGFPLDQDVLDDLQNGILEAEAALASLVGPLVIFSGCVVAGGNVGNGVVAINGQIMPFVGAATGTKVIVREIDTDLVYFNGAVLPSNIERYATFGDDGVQNNLWANFVRVSANGIIADINTINTQITTINTTLAKKGTVLASGNYPVGDVPAPGETYNVAYGAALTTTNYIVLTTIICANIDPVNGLVNSVQVTSKTVNGFSIYLHEPSNLTQNISIDWIVIAL